MGWSKHILLKIQIYVHLCVNNSLKSQNRSNVQQIVSKCNVTKFQRIKYVFDNSLKKNQSCKPEAFLCTVIGVKINFFLNSEICTFVRLCNFFFIFLPIGNFSPLFFGDLSFMRICYTFDLFWDFNELFTYKCTYFWIFKKICIFKPLFFWGFSFYENIFLSFTPLNKGF